MRPAGLEPATYGFEDRCSIQLRYGRGSLTIPLRHLAGIIALLRDARINSVKRWLVDCAGVRR